MSKRAEQQVLRELYQATRRGQHRLTRLGHKLVPDKTHPATFAFCERCRQRFLLAAAALDSFYSEECEGQG